VNFLFPDYSRGAFPYQGKRDFRSGISAFDQTNIDAVIFSLLLNDVRIYRCAHPARIRRWSSSQKQDLRQIVYLRRDFRRASGCSVYVHL